MNALSRSDPNEPVKMHCEVQIVTAEMADVRGKMHEVYAVVRASDCKQLHADIAKPQPEEEEIQIEESMDRPSSESPNEKEPGASTTTTIDLVSNSVTQSEDAITAGCGAAAPGGDSSTAPGPSGIQQWNIVSACGLSDDSEELVEEELEDGMEMLHPALEAGDHLPQANTAAATTQQQSLGAADLALSRASESGPDCIPRAPEDASAKVETDDGSFASFMAHFNNRTQSGDRPHGQHQSEGGVNSGSVSASTIGDKRESLNRAAASGRILSVRRLLAAAAAATEYPGLDLDWQHERDGATAVYRAAQNGHVAVVRALLEQSADSNRAKEDTGATPCYIAANNGHFDAVRLLLGHKADPNQARTDDGRTPIFTAAKNGHIDVVELLLEHNADPNQAMVHVGGPVTPKNDAGTTPLFTAANHGHVGIVAYLLEHGADPNKARTDDGRTPVFVAAEIGHLEVLKVLLAHGANPNESRHYDSPSLATNALKCFKTKSQLSSEATDHVTKMMLRWMDTT